MYDRDYGRLGRIGLLTPQANPTAEPEMALLLPDAVTLLTSRCTSRGGSRERFLGYFEKMDRTLAAFDTLRLDAAGFACTASSYLVDRGDEARKCRELETVFGYPIVTAAAAIGRALRFLGAESIALACPYPNWLFERAVDFWKTGGYRVEASLSLQPQMEDTRAIYEVSGADAGGSIARAFEGTDADVLLITGTGMPGLQALADLQRLTGKPALNSNLCLAMPAGGRHSAR